MDPILQKFRSKFIEEAYQLLDQLEKTLLELEQNQQNIDLIHAAFRAMHTLKGTSGMYGFEAISEFTHQFESLFQNIREGKIELDRNIIEISLKSVDHLRQLLQDENLEKNENKSTHTQLIKEVVVLLNRIESPILNENKPQNQSNNNEEEKTFTYQILLRTDEKLFFRGINLLNIFKDLSERGNFYIEHLKNMSNDDADWWNIIYTTDAQEEDIREILMFIEDNCFVSRLSERNLIEQFENTNQIIDEKSILEYIEAGNYDNTRKESSLTKESNTKVPHSNRRIAVDSNKLDLLMYLVSELITVNAQLNIAHEKTDLINLGRYLEKLDSLSKHFRNNALELRLVPLADIVLRFQRMIRDLSKQLQKKIKLITHGVEVELDKSTIDQLYEPLMHIIRNCIDHGIEQPSIRRQKGKSEEGTITITASHSGNHVIITVEDDGCGIDHEKVRRKAVEKGIWPENYKPSEKEIYDLIFLPGFSTAQSLTAVSGRGVGMDVVLKKIQDLRGNIIVSSQREVGTKFTIYLQQSMAILDTLLFTVENQFFVVPISDIEVCEQTSLTNIINREHTKTFVFRNQLIPYVNLRQHFQLTGEYPSKVKVIVVNHSQGNLAILADKIVGEHQAVLKPLGSMLRNQKFITSACQLGDGNMAFMLDIAELNRSLTNNLYQQHISIQN
ncbi:MAG: chemotaxis protein CheA [Bacteroidales bacterium]|nr:chemotaxis protein CheA [Bacteroidales bacterium]